MAGHGRPAVEEPKIKKTTVRFSEVQDKQLNEYATKHNLTKSQVLVKAFDMLMKKERRKKVKCEL